MLRGDLEHGTRRVLYVYRLPDMQAWVNRMYKTALLNRTADAMKSVFSKLCLAAALTVSGAAAHADATARYSISYLVRLHQGEQFLMPAPPGADTAPFKQGARQAAQAYVAGVIDSAEGVRWCVNRSTVPPRELDQQLIDALAAHPQPESNAAKALSRALAKRFPCRPPKR
jgi:Rap1a immunity proteins